MKKIVRLTENDLARIVKRVINEDINDNDLYRDIINVLRSSNATRSEKVDVLNVILDEMGTADNIRSRFKRQSKEINELNRETWMSAADKADKSGYKKLATKFREHGNEFGLIDPKKEFEMVFNKRDGEVNLKLRLISIIKSDWGNSFDMRVEDEAGKKYEINVNNFGGFPKFYLDKEWDGLALNRREAKKILNILKDEGIDVTSDTRSISYEDVGF